MKKVMICSKIKLYVISIIILLASINVYSVDYPDECYSMNDKRWSLVSDIITSQYLYDFCDETIYDCLNKSNPCKLAKRLAKHVCKMVTSGKSKKQIIRSLSKRAMTMLGTDLSGEFDLEDTAVVGKSSSPVTVLVYACPRCPFCSKIIPKIYKKIVKGSLVGKAKLVFKPFPLKSHKDSVESGIAYLSANEQGRGWCFLLEAYKNFNNYRSKKDFISYAKKKNMDILSFKAVLNASSTRKELIESKKEGLYVGVKSTPTFFINGKLYQTNLEAWLLEDVILEEYDRIKGIY